MIIEKKNIVIPIYHMYSNNKRVEFILYGQYFKVALIHNFNKKMVQISESKFRWKHARSSGVQKYLPFICWKS